MYNVSKLQLENPQLDEIINVLQHGLSQNFSSVEVKCVECPDLTKEPFCLSAKGLCGKPRIIDVGGPPYLLPLVQREKQYDIRHIASLAELPGAFLLGAGAGPWQVVGGNSELICNVHLSADSQDGKDGVLHCNSYVAKVNVEDGSCHLGKLDHTAFSLMGNFFCCEGKPGKVIEINASIRTGNENFMSAVRKALHHEYKEHPVCVGGVFLVKQGKARIHVMPDFSSTPLNTDAAVDEWLQFYEMEAPLVCVGELISHDPGLDLRMEHFHCFSNHVQGGHYHYDTTPHEVVYQAYLNTADFLYRVDQPPGGCEWNMRCRD